MRYYLALFVANLLATLWSNSWAQGADPFVLLSITGDAQTTGLNQVFPKRLVVRLTDGNGIPLQGAHINFQNIPCLSVLGSLCEFPGAPGQFESGSDNATVATSVTGLATSPAYFAGGSLGTDPRVNNPGAIGVAAYVVPDEAPYFFSISVTVTHPVVFQLSEVPLAQSMVAAPSISHPSQGALCLLLVACGIWRLQRRGSR